MPARQLSTTNIRAFAERLCALLPEAADVIAAEFEELLDGQRTYERERKAKQRECPRDDVPGTASPSFNKKNKKARLRIEDYQPTELDLAAARRAGLDESQTEEALLEFRAYHADAEPQEWSWAFRGWCDRRLRIIAARARRIGQGRASKPATPVETVFLVEGSPEWIAAGSPKWLGEYDDKLRKGRLMKIAA